MPHASIFKSTILIALSGILVTQIEADCSPPWKWSIQPKPCGRTQTEIKREQRKSDNMWKVHCCDNSETKSTFDYWDKSAKGCVITECVDNSKADSNKCDKMPTNTYVKGKLLRYTETATDECKLGNGKVGVLRLCCPDDSTDTLLATLHGAENREFPHFARVGKYGCGGTVYNKRWILTAAHCLTDNASGKVRAPSDDPNEQHAYEDCCSQISINLEIKDSTNQANNLNVYNVSELHVHPNSTFLTPQPNGTVSEYDIALVKVDKDIQFSDQVKALRIPDADYDPLMYGDRAIILGFGATDTGLNSPKMLKANVKIWREDEVNFALSDTTLSQVFFVGGIHNGVINPGVGTGDSGGPAICRGPSGTAMLCGVTSFTGDSDACHAALDDYSCIPSAYNRVGVFAEWIKETAGDQSGVEFYDQPLFGEDVRKKEYPAHVHITDSSGGKCGGTVVADNVVLTAASCVIDDRSGNVKNGLKVTVGLRDLKKGKGEEIGIAAVGPIFGFSRAKREAGRERKLAKRIVSWPMERYQKGRLEQSVIMRDPYYHNNLAFVKLIKGTNLGKKIPKIATKSPTGGDSAMEVAFPFKPLGSANKDKIPLSKRQFKLLDKETCQRRLDRLSILGQNIKIDGSLMCGVEKYSGGSSCDRELGGGLYCKEGGKEVLCGVQVFRMCEFNIPNGFMDLGGQSKSIVDNIERFKNA